MGWAQEHVLAFAVAAVFGWLAVLYAVATTFGAIR
jgi:hypothetical protein